MIFDGRRLPGKAEALVKRRKAREEILKKERKKLVNNNYGGNIVIEVDDEEARVKKAKFDAIWQQMEEEQKIDDARNCAHYGTDLVSELIKEFQKNDVDYLVAPYEADAQITYLIQKGYGDVVITEDGDLVVHGCDTIFFKMQRTGVVNEIFERKKLHQCLGFEEGYDHKRMVWKALLSGCDYIASLKGIGIGTAIKIVNATPDSSSTEDMLRSISKILNRPDMIIDEAYIKNFLQAEFVFTHPLVFDPETKTLVPLTPYPTCSQISEEFLHAAGPRFPDEEAYDLARGIISNKIPFTLRQDLETWKPSSSSIWHPDFNIKFRLDTDYICQRHLIELPQQKIPVCRICGKVFTYEYLLKRHEFVHTGYKVFKCGVCGKKFSTKYQLKEHFRHHSGEKPYNCPFCKKSFRIVYQLWNHKKVHFPARKYQCTECHMRFKQIGGLRSHKAVHKEAKKYQCLQCLKRFKRTGGLKRHMEIHVNERQFAKCELCHKIMFKSSMPLHMKITHSPNDRFSCTLCTFTTKYSNSLKYHMTAHSGEKKWKCSLCDKLFIYKRYLKKHEFHHINPNRLKCRHCKFTSNWPHVIKDHVSRHNTQNQGSEQMEKKEPKQHQVLAIKSTPSHVCPVCRLKTTSNMSLNAHYNKQHRPQPTNVRGKIVCGECDATLADKTGYLSHIVHFHPIFPSTAKLFQGSEQMEKKEPKQHQVLAIQSTPSHVCPLCSKKFMAKKSLCNHYNLEHRTKATKLVDGKISCGECEVISINQQAFNNHVTRYHNIFPSTPKKLYSCVPCNFNGASNYKLREHFKTIKHKQAIKSNSKSVTSQKGNTGGQASMITKTLGVRII